MINTNDIQGIIALAISNNKPGVIQAMNITGNPVASNVSDADLMAALWSVFANQGSAGLTNVLSRVSIDTDKITQEQAKFLVVKFKGTDPNAKFGDWLKGVGDYFGDLLGGSAVTTGTVQNVSSEPALSPTMIGLIVVAGIILIAIFRKFTAVVVGIIVIVMAAVLYGVFAKKITTTTTGGGTTSHGGIGKVLIGWLTGGL